MRTALTILTILYNSVAVAQEIGWSIDTPVKTIPSVELRGVLWGKPFKLKAALN